MAKKKPRARRSRRRPEVSVETAELSLEEILEEYRSRGKEASGEMPEYTADTAAEDAPGASCSSTVCAWRSGKRAGRQSRSG